MTFTYRPARRQAIPLLLGVAGGTGSGKTFSAMRLARGIAKGQPFYVIDTENGRALHYADEFEFQHGELKAPFRPSAYADAIAQADKAGAPVIVVDSASHEWAGDGGCLDWHDELMRGQESRKMLAWVDPKADHKRFLNRLLQVNAHVILCFRAEPKVDIVKGKDGKMEIVPKQAAQKALDGWLPISEKMLPYEMTASFLLMADAPGVPRPIKLPGALQKFVPLNAPLSEEVGLCLAEWAAGSSSTTEEPQEATSGERSLSADSQDATGEPASEGLTMTEFANRVRDHNITQEHGAQVMANLYPGRRASELTDEERAAVWNKLEEVTPDA